MKGIKLSAREIKEKVLSDATYRKKIWQKFLKHVEAGYSLDCFSELSWQSLQELMKKHPNECSQDDLETSQRDGKIHWEGIGSRQAIGTCLGNSRTWYYNMSNRYGWSDRIDSKVDNTHSGQVTIVNYTKKPS